MTDIRPCCLRFMIILLLDLSCNKTQLYDCFAVRLQLYDGFAAGFEQLNFL